MAVKKGDILNFDYTGSVQTVTLPKGTYKLEVWGAQGGYRSSSSYGGMGGYSVGTLTLSEKTTLYVYAGGSGNTGGTSGGFNGGGSRDAYNGGGGGSDIRLRKDSLYARVIVAGGGGSDGASNRAGGYGGGDSGQAPSSGYGTAGGGGTQTSGGSGGGGNPGTFGVGGAGAYYSSGHAGAGGGGWYGGGGSYPDGSGDDDKGGAGGSGYIYTSNTKSNYPSGCLLTSADCLSSASMKDGGASFTSPTGSSETGHSGNGYCRITVVECNNTALYGKINNSIKKATGFYFKLNNKMYSIRNSNNPAIMNFDYTGSVQSMILTPGIYTFECWGAQGGNGCSESAYIGGMGGYSKGTLTLTQTENLYIYVGGKGVSSASSGAGNLRDGGFNGGGSGRDWSSTNHGGSGGGGATDIRLSTNSLYSRIIVAGGGGGASDNGNGGAGGGTSGISGNSSPGTATAGSGFGQAAASSYTTGECGGGGGGWYGGYGGSSENYSGGGGSGYVYTSSTAKNYPSGCLLNSSFYLTDAQTIAGNTSFTSPTGSSEVGHTGNGYCRITALSQSQCSVYAKKNGTWIHIDF